MYTDVIATMLKILLVAVLIAVFVTWVFAFVYMRKTISNYHPERRWGQFLPISVFMPWFFTEQGNKYRRKLLTATVLFILLVICGFGIGFLIESLKPT